MSHTSSQDLRARWRRWAADRRTAASAVRRRARLQVEDLEARALLAGVTEYPIPSKAGSALQIVTGPDKNLWFTENDPVSNHIGQVTTSGKITEFNMPTFGANPRGIAVGPDGNLWFTEQFGDKIGEITPGGQFTEYPTPSGQQLAGITVGPDGNLWFGSVLGGQIGMINATTHAVTEYKMPKSGWPTTLTVGPDNNIWFSDPFNNSLGTITTSGQITEYSLNNISIVADPEGIVSDPKTNSLWVNEDFYGYIGEFSTSGASLHQYKVPGKSTSPSAITIDSSGNLWFTETGSDGNIGELNPATGQFTMYPLPAGAKTDGIAVGPDGNIWFTDQGNKAIGVLNIGGSTGSPTPTPTPSPSPSPTPSPTTPTPTPSPTTPTPTPISIGTGVTTTITGTPTGLTPPPASSPVAISPAHRPPRHRRPPRVPVHQRPHRSTTGHSLPVRISPVHPTFKHHATAAVQVAATSTAGDPHQEPPVLPPIATSGG